MDDAPPTGRAVIGMTPTQEARYALDWGGARSDLSMPAQLEYDRLKDDFLAQGRPLPQSEPAPTARSSPAARAGAVSALPWRRPPAAAGPCEGGEGM